MNGRAVRRESTHRNSVIAFAVDPDSRRVVVLTEHTHRVSRLGLSDHAIRLVADCLHARASR